MRKKYDMRKPHIFIIFSLCLVFFSVYIKGQEYPDFCHPGTFVSFPDYTATSSGTSGNGPVGPENSV